MKASVPLLVAALAAPAALALCRGGEEVAAAADGEEAPAVRKVGVNLYRIGGIEFDAAERELRIPVTVNMQEGGPMEYLLVHETGKVHESVFVTKESPWDVQIAMKLLRFRDGHGDVFNRMLPAELVAEQGGSIEERGDPVEVLFVAGGDGGGEIAASEFILDAETAAPMTPEPWIFTGSSMHEGAFMAELEGSIVAVYLDPLAMFNMTREDAEIDRRWWGNPEAIPEIGTPGTLLLRPGADGEGGKQD